MQTISGIVPPLVTPLRSSTELDTESQTRLIDHVIAGDVNGIFVLGTTGEGPALSSRLQCATVAGAVRAARGRVPVLAGISHAALEESVKLARAFADAGANAVVLAPPCYYPLGQPELLDYFQTLIPNLPLPVYLYNMPSMTKISISPETLCRVADIKGVVGIKDSSANMINFHEYLTVMRDRPEFAVMMGPDELMAEAVFFGASGGVNGGAIVCPQLFTALYEAARMGNREKMRQLQVKVFQLRKMYSFGAFFSTYVKGVKGVLKLMGIIADDCTAAPVRPFNPPEMEKLRQLLAELNLL